MILYSLEVRIDTALHRSSKKSHLHLLNPARGRRSQGRGPRELGKENKLEYKLKGRKQIQRYDLPAGFQEHNLCHPKMEIFLRTSWHADHLDQSVCLF